MELSLQINEVAKIMRMSRDAIRFYEKKQIVQPDRTDENQYRHYSQKDLRRITDCRIYQSMGFSLAEIVEIFDNASEEKLEKMIDEKELELIERLKTTQLMLERLRSVKTVPERLLFYDRNYYIRVSPHSLFSAWTAHERANWEAIESSFYSEVSEHHNYFTCSALIPWDAVNGSDMRERMGRGFSINYEDAKVLGLSPDDNIVELPPRKCIYTMFRADPIVGEDNLAPILHWMSEHNHRLTGDVFCRTLKVSFHCGNDSRYYEAWLPID